MIKNKIYNTNPCFFHAPGKIEKCIHWDDILKMDNKDEFQIPSNLEIITWNTNSNSYYKKLGTFEKSLNNHKIKYTVLNTKKAWTTNRLKISLTLDFLNKSKSEYILGADSSDVVLINNPEKIIDLLSIYNKKIVFNSEIKFWKPEILKDCFEYENKTSPGPFKFLNAGLWLAETNYAKTFFELVHSISQEFKELPYSEQACIKIASINNTNVGIDYKCCFFQCINQITNEHLEI